MLISDPEVPSCMDCGGIMSPYSDAEAALYGEKGGWRCPNCGNKTEDSNGTDSGGAR